jgi:hypothetical protein
VAKGAKVPKAVRDYLRKIGAKGGAAHANPAGGRARMEALTPEERSVLGRRAAAAKAKKKRRVD